MMTVHCLVFGERERRHELLAASLPRAEVPSELWNLTDQPPGHLPPGTLMAPLFGCGPVGTGWALWRTFADVRAARGGMVQTHVRWLSLEAVAALDDLQPVLDSLPTELAGATGAEALRLESAAPAGALPWSPGYARFVELFSDEQRTRPVVLSGELSPEQVLRDLWRALFWPEARRELKFRSSFAPETLGAQPSRDMVVFTLHALLPRWKGWPVLSSAGEKAGSSEGVVKLLLGQMPASFRALVRELESPRGRLEDLPKLLQTHAPYERLRQGHASPEDGVALLRRMAFLVPEPTLARPLKKDVLEWGRGALPRWSAEQVGSLANIALTAFPDGERDLSRAVEQWVERQLQQGARELPAVLLRARRTGSGSWWSTAVRTGLRRQLLTAAPTTWDALWRTWVESPEVVPWVEELLPEGAEAALVASCPLQLPPSTAEAVLALARARHWSSLHGAVLSTLDEPATLLTRQVAFPHAPAVGLEVLARRLGPERFIQEFIREPSEMTLAVALPLLQGQPALLKGLEPQVPGWRMLWLEYLRAGGDAWPHPVEPGERMRELMEVMRAGEPLEPELLERLSADSRSHLLGVPRRTELWERLPPRVSNALRTSTAHAWLQALDRDEPVEAPEPPLHHALLSVLGTKVPAHRSVRPATLLRLVESVRGLSESVIRAWFRELASSPRFSREEAVRLGHACRQYAWSQLVSDAFGNWRNDGREDLLPMLHACEHLLGFLQRWRLPIAAFSSGPQPRPVLKVFLSYSRGDEAIKEALRKHLKHLERDGLLSVWDDRHVHPGEDWDPRILEELRAADIILLLVSADFLHSDYCWTKEVPLALERHARSEALVVPVILRECDWKATRLGALGALPRGGRPVMRDDKVSDDALTEVASELRHLIRDP